MKRTTDKTPILGWRLFWVLLALTGVSLAVHLALYPALPDQVPRQWAMSGEVNSWMSKTTLPWLWMLPVALVLLFKILPVMDPRSDSYRKSRRMWNVFTACFTVGFVAFTWMTELYLWGPGAVWQVVPRLLIAAVATGLIALGNYMPRIRQNYTMGAKTPWALADEHCWQRTQRMAGIVFILGGVMLLASILEDLLLGTGVLVYVFLALLLGGIAWVYLYSWLVYIGKMK